MVRMMSRLLRECLGLGLGLQTGSRWCSCGVREV